MERGSTKHTARIDEEMHRESAALEQAQTFGGRVEEHRMTEEPYPDGPGHVDYDGDERAGIGSGISLEDRELRSEIARAVDGSVFPAGRDALLLNASEKNAPDRVIKLLTRLPDGPFETLGDVWEALGGPKETRF